jgi:hypothetical protein
MKFNVGDPVRKVNGNYQANGEVRAAFTNKAGEPRYVFEFADLPGMLHIFNEAQLRRGHDASLIICATSSMALQYQFTKQEPT